MATARRGGLIGLDFNSRQRHAMMLNLQHCVCVVQAAIELPRGKRWKILYSRKKVQVDDLDMVGTLNVDMETS